MKVSLLCSTLLLGQMVAAQSIGGQGSIPPGTLMKPGEWRFFTVHPNNIENKLSVNLVAAVGDADLYLRKNANPDLLHYDFRSATSSKTESLTVTNGSNPSLTSDNWVIGVYAKQKCFITETHSVTRTASEFSGNGAVTFNGGTTFRTFAPNATQVNVAGTFNSWSATVAPMTSEGNGWWSLDYRTVGHGAQYKFVIKNGATVWKNDPWARQLTNSVGNSVVYDQSHYQWQTQNFVTPSWNKTVVYEMHVGAFNDSAGGAPGTFATAEAKLDSLADLGVNVLELLPVSEFPGDFSWGYNPSYPWSVESAYGGPEALKHFVDQANARGMAVVLDVVHNHYGPNDLDMWRYDGWYQGTYGGLFFYNDGRSDTPWGPRPDFGRGEVRNYVRDSVLNFAQNYRVSGFRWDSVQYTGNTNWGNNPDGWSLMQYVNDSIDSTQPWKISIAEDMQNNAWVTKTTGAGGAGFDTQWSNFVHTVRSALTATDDSSRDMNAVAGALNERFNGDAFQRVIYTESHDEDANGHQRLPSEIDTNNAGSYWAQKRSTLGAALVMTAPGIPMLFMGQEFLEDGFFDITDPLDWSKSTTYSGIRKLYKDLISLRKNSTGHSAGLAGQGMNLFHNNNTNKVLAFHRFDQGGSGDDVVCVFNFKNTTWTNYRIGLPRAGGWSVAFNSDWNGYSPQFGNSFSPNFQADSVPYDGLNFSGTVTVAPYSCLILTKD